MTEWRGEKDEDVRSGRTANDAAIPGMSPGPPETGV